MKTLVLALALFTALVVAACGDSDEGPATSPIAPTTTVIPADTTTAGTAVPTHTTVPAKPAGTPDATLPMGKIAFSSRRDVNGELYLLTPDGSVNITNDPAEDIESDLSPDGEKVVFASDRHGSYHIYVVNVDGSGLTQLTSDRAGDFSPRWSPDGKLIAFSRTGSIFVMDAPC